MIIPTQLKGYKYQVFTELYNFNWIQLKLRNVPTNNVNYEYKLPLTKIELNLNNGIAHLEIAILILIVQEIAMIMSVKLYSQVTKEI